MASMNQNPPAKALFWYMLDVDNYQLITSPYLIPSDIKDSKDIVLAETPIPGLNFKPITYGGGGNRKISFTLPIIKRQPIIGNVQIVNQFEMLRNQSTGYTKVFSGQFTPTPRVLYQWGLHSTPQVYWVKKCDFSHRADFVNSAAYPQFTMVDIELWLDETSNMYHMEEVFRKASATAAGGLTVASFMMQVKPI